MTYSRSSNYYTVNVKLKWKILNKIFCALTPESVFSVEVDKADKRTTLDEVSIKVMVANN